MQLGIKHLRLLEVWNDNEEAIERFKSVAREYWEMVGPSRSRGPHELLFISQLIGSVSISLLEHLKKWQENIYPQD